MTATLVAADSRTTAVLDRVRVARESRTPLRIRGAGTWMHAGRPVDASEDLSLADDQGIVEYVPGDLTITVRGGTRLSEIQAATQRHGQWLPLDPWGGDAGTIGATIATGTTGPHAHAMGLPRDVVLGAEVVSGAEQVIRAGGRVVKNVAGFDLTRLMVGAWGTLGVITEVTLRLRAQPEVVRSVGISVRTDARKLHDLTSTLRTLPFTPLACELLHSDVAVRVGFPKGDVLIARTGGNRRAVEAQVDLLRALGTMVEIPDDVWTRLRELEPGAVATWRWSQLPSVFGETWAALQHAGRDTGLLLHGSPLRGVARAVAPADGHARLPDLARKATGFAGTVAIDVLPSDGWALVTPGANGAALARSIRRTFDPDAVLNRGILGRDE
jgi:glycolate oxidase FAD binding subunit